MRKKRIIISAVILLVFAAVIIPQIAHFPLSVRLSASFHGPNPPQLIAHRGFSSAYPENTVPAFKAAIEKGFYGCEFDIHTTSDGKWIVNHDDTLDGMTDGSGKISEKTYDEIMSYRVDSGNGIKDFHSLKLSDLDKTLALFKNSETVPFIEVKGYTKQAFPSLMETIEKYGLTDKAVIISFHMDALNGIRELDKDIKMLYLTSSLTKKDVDECIKNGNTGIDINGKNISKIKEAVKYAAENSLDIAAWTIDSTFETDILHRHGIYKITTNRIIP